MTSVQRDWFRMRASHRKCLRAGGVVGSVAQRGHCWIAPVETKAYGREAVGLAVGSVMIHRAGFRSFTVQLAGMRTNSANPDENKSELDHHKKTVGGRSRSKPKIIPVTDNSTDDNLNNSRSNHSGRSFGGRCRLSDVCTKNRMRVRASGRSDKTCNCLRITCPGQPKANWRRAPSLAVRPLPGLLASGHLVTESIALVQWNDNGS